MAMPSLIYQGTAAVSGTGAISVARPTGVLQTGDVELLFIETANQAVTVPSGWNQAPGSPLGVGTAAATTATRLTILWRYSAGETTAISIADPGDHIIAYYMAFRDCDLTNPFYDNLNPITYSSATASTNFSIEQTYGAIINNLVYIDCLANQYDSSSAATADANASYLFSYNDESGQYYPYGDCASWQTSSGNGGGLRVCWQFNDLSHLTRINGIEIYAAVNIYPCYIMLRLQGNQSSDRTGVASFSATSSVSVSADGTGVPDTCPFVFAASSVFSGTGAISVDPCFYRYDGGNIESTAEWNNKFELLVVETASQAVTLIDPVGWQAVPNTPVTTGSAAGTSSTSLYAFWRIHPSNWADNADIADPGDHVVARRYIFNNVDTTDPILTVVYTDPAFGNYSNSISPTSGGNGDGAFADAGYIVSSSGMFSVLGFCSWATDSATRAFELNVDPPYDPVYYTTEGPEFSTNTWNIFPSPIPFETGTTQGNGGGFHAWIGKRYLNTTSPGNTYENRGRIQPAPIGAYASMQYQVAFWIAIQSAAAPPSADGQAIISHSSSVTATYQRSLQEGAGVASILYTATVGVSYSRSPEFFKEANILLSSSVLMTGQRIQGGAFALDYVLSLVVSNFKTTPVSVFIQHGSQAVPVSRKGGLYSLSFQFAHSVSATGLKEEIGTDSGFGSFSVQLISQLIAAGTRGITRAAVILESTSVAAGCSPGRKAGVSFPFTSLTDAFCKKTILGPAVFLSSSAVVGTQKKGAFSPVLIALLHNLPVSVRKTSSGEFLVSLLALILSQGRLVTTFEYGDLIVVDLRATPLGLEQSCVRLSPVVEVRRGEDLEFSATREGLEAPGRRRTLEIIGEQARLLGKEIVCVREVFDESK